MRKHMRSGIILLACVLAALAVLLNTHPFGSKPARLSALMMNSSEFEALTAVRKEDPSLFDTMRCNDYVLPTASASFYYSMIEGDPYALDPLVEVQGKGALSLAFCSTTPDEDFLRSGAPIPFAVYTDTAYALGELYVTTLPVMDITVTEPDGEGSFEIYDRIERKAVMTLFDNRGGIPARSRIVHSDTSIRLRGASSAYLPKKSYRLSLSMVSPGENVRHNPQALLGMRSDEDWILYAPSADPERIRNSLSNNLWYQSCAANNYRQQALGVECRYVELVMNGEYMGLYSLMFPLDEKQVGLPDDGLYYRGISYEETTPEMLRQAGNEPVVGGWELRGPKEIKTEGAARWEPLAAYFDSLIHPEDKESPDWLTQHLDMDNVIDLHLFLSLVQGYDNYLKNHNLIVYPEREPDYRVLMAPWDLDLTWGNSYDPNTEWKYKAYSQSCEDPFSAKWTLPAERMLANSPSTRTVFLARWKELRSGAWSDASIMTQLDDYEAQIYASGAMARDCSRWPTAPSTENLDQFREYALARLHYLDDYFEEALQ